jgi:serine O-acetyltransferase
MAAKHPRRSPGESVVLNNLREAWATYERDPWRRGLWVMAVYCFGRWRYRIKPRVIRAPFSFAYRVLRTMSEIVTGVELPCETAVGKRFRIDHCGDIVISGDAIIGDDVVIRNGVTIGLRHVGHRGSPTIGNRVDIGAGAKILGPISVGDDVFIGANAVVLRDVPANSIAIGVPARNRARLERIPRGETDRESEDDFGSIALANGNIGSGGGSST